MNNQHHIFGQLSKRFVYDINFLILPYFLVWNSVEANTQFEVQQVVCALENVAKLFWRNLVKVVS